MTQRSVQFSKELWYSLDMDEELSPRESTTAKLADALETVREGGYEWYDLNLTDEELDYLLRLTREARS